LIKKKREDKKKEKNELKNNKNLLKTHEQQDCKMFNFTLFLNVLRGEGVSCFHQGDSKFSELESYSYV